VSRLQPYLDRFVHTIEGPEGPRLAWTLRAYRPAQLSGDVVSGLTVAALIVPLSIGYAGVAGLPPEMGLYASLAPLVAYAVFGSARRLIVGPDASTAALIGATIIPLAAAGDDRVRIASVLALLVAAVFVAMRLGKMGFLADFLSRPILVGYMTGVGITVAVGQVATILGGPAIAEGVGVLTRIDWLSSNLAAVFEAVRIAVVGSGAEMASLVIGVLVILMVVIGRRLAPRVPMALPAMLVALAASYVLDLQSQGVQVLGPVPAGLPSIGIPIATPTEVLSLLPGALGLALLSFADTTATGRTFSGRHGERTDANRELVALAAADAAGALTGGYPISSSPSRTAAAEASGTTSQMTGLVAALSVAVVLVLLTGPLSYLPMPALGAVILVSVFGLIDLEQIRGMWLLRHSEAVIALIAMTGVIVYGTLVGVGIAVLLAALNIVRRAAWPRIVELGRQHDGSWRDLQRSRDGDRVVGVVVLRFTGPLFFANVSALEARVRAVVAERPDTEAVVLDLGATADVDLTAAGGLAELQEDLERDGRRLAVARPAGTVRDQLRAYGLADLMRPTGGTRGSIDEVIVGLGLDPRRSAAPHATVSATGVSATGAAGTGARATPVAARSRLPWEPAEPTNRLVLRVLVIGLVVVAIAATLGIALRAWDQGQTTGTVTVPNLVGLSLDRATIAASDAGLELTPPVYVQRSDRPDGTVVDQDPPAGTVVDRGSTLVPIVATGSRLVFVPAVVGLPEGQAIAALTGADLKVSRGATQQDPTVPAGTVLAVDPAAGTSVAAGTTVTYVVSTNSAPDPSAAPTQRPPGSGGASPGATATPAPTPSVSQSPPPIEPTPSAGSSDPVLPSP
jgi:SulP family sulfate permease